MEMEIRRWEMGTKQKTRRKRRKAAREKEDLFWNMMRRAKSLKASAHTWKTCKALLKSPAKPLGCCPWRNAPTTFSARTKAGVHGAVGTASRKWTYSEPCGRPTAAANPPLAKPKWIASAEPSSTASTRP